MEPISQPQEPQQPQATPSPAGPQMPNQQPPNSATPAPKKKQSKLVIIAISLAVVLAMLVLIFFFIVVPSVVAIQDRANIANQTATFFQLGEAADDSKLGELLTPDASLDDITFTTDMAQKVGSDCVADDAVVEVFRDKEPKQATSVVKCAESSQEWKLTFEKHDNNNWYLNGIVLLGNDAVQNNSSSEPQARASESNCFSPSDYSEAFGWDNTIAYTKESPHITNVHFLPDSLEYSSTLEQGNIETFAKIATTNPGKDYSVHVYGSVATTGANDLSFANQRADKVKNALVDEGMDKSKITIDEPQNIVDIGYDDASSATAKEAARAVIMKFIPQCTTSDESPSSGR